MRVITVVAEPVLRTDLNQAPGVRRWAAVSLQHEVGRRLGKDQWTANPVQDKASGYLARGMESKELTAGEYEVSFDLKVDNFNRDPAPVGVISVVNLETKKVEAERELKRREFPNGLYQTFSLRFKAVAGQRYDFRTFWYHAEAAPQLTQLGVTLKPIPLTRSLE
jgi:hypothetical protein